MRWWIPQGDDRLPDPEPAKPDERVPVLIGAGLWVAALVVAVIVLPSAKPEWLAPILWTVGAAIVIGAILFGFALHTRARQKR